MRRHAVIAAASLALAGGVVASEKPAPRELLAAQAHALAPEVASDLARAFLAAVPDLLAPGSPRVVYYDRETRDALSEDDALALPAEERESYERRELDEHFYWFTRYGTPLAFVRPLDLLGSAGLESVDGARVVDFGFGSIGQLRLLASLGAEAIGVDVDPMLRALYRRPEDAGSVPRARVAGSGGNGSVRLVIGSFPGDEEVAREVGSGWRAFVSKNTLKNGYIHPAEEVDPRQLVHLGVEDETFVRAVYDRLQPGGWFLIYNLCPPPSPDRYIPWADGRCPFAREICEGVGFSVLAYDRDDTDAARAMGEALGWGEQMNLETDLFGIYSLFRKPGD